MTNEQIDLVQASFSKIEPLAEEAAVLFWNIRGSLFAEKQEGSRPLERSPNPSLFKCQTAHSGETLENSSHPDSHPELFQSGKCVRRLQCFGNGEKK